MTSFFFVKHRWFELIVVFCFVSWNWKKTSNYLWNSMHCLELLCRSQSPNPLSRCWGRRGQKDVRFNRKKPKPWTEGFRRDPSARGQPGRGRKSGGMQKVRNRLAQKCLIYLPEKKKQMYILILHVRWVGSLIITCYILNMNLNPNSKLQYISVYYLLISKHICNVSLEISRRL